MVYFFHHYEIPAVVQQGTTHHIAATVNIHEHQRAPERRSDQPEEAAANTESVSTESAASPSAHPQVCLTTFTFSSHTYISGHLI